MIHIDGFNMEGGGLFVRTALGLTTLTGQPFRVDKIRHHRPKPGIKRQHLRCIDVLKQLPGMKFGTVLFLLVIILAQFQKAHPAAAAEDRRNPMIDIPKTVERLKAHLHELTEIIGERSVRLPHNLAKTAAYIQTFYKDIGLAVHNEPYDYQEFKVANVVVEISSGSNPARRYLIGAHYDSVAGTVGADDNASAIAVQLEIARNVKTLLDRKKHDLAVKFVSFALEEPPAYATKYMGSRVYAKNAHQVQEKIDGMICLEMVGYTCHEPGCQKYMFPLGFLGYPKEGNFIGIVSNFKSGGFAKDLLRSFEENRELPAVKLKVPFNGWILPSVRLSDHASFWDQGYKAVMVTDSAFLRNPHYHLPSDTMEKLDYEFMAELVESIVLFFYNSH
ncbi:MAG: M28 family peptidase [Deltaproteobacteria bacterium]|nr:M28 family peptidase [Deltaproteobacteria bacterium]